MKRDRDLQEEEHSLYPWVYQELVEIPHHPALHICLKLKIQTALTEFTAIKRPVFVFTFF